MNENMNRDTNLIDQKITQLQKDVETFSGILSSLLLQLQSDLNDPNSPAPNETLIEFGDNLINARSAGNDFVRYLSLISAMRDAAR